MQLLTDSAFHELSSIAQRYGISTDAARAMLDAVWRGNGSMAQFNHPELGGYGQWMRGGMTMVGDMFNNGLKAMVDGLCNDLSRLLERGNPYLASESSNSYGGSNGYGNWWPSELGSPNSSGSQNQIRYAYFAGPRRLAIEDNGQVTVYDTLQHQIGGVSQQQSGGYSLSFSSQFGTVDLSQLPVVSGKAPHAPAAPQPYVAPQAYTAPQSYSAPPAASSDNEGDIFAKIERLAALRQNGVLTDDEFNAKKAELLARI
ncbi:MAG TPA: SHOCT domain-containing protein [Polyangiales bacterium]